MLRRSHKPKKSAPSAGIMIPSPDEGLPPTAKKLVGYLRVSTDEQRQEGISLDVQRERIVTYATMFKLNLLAIYCDDYTGRELNRPGFKAALAKMVETEAILVAVSLDRISRSVADWTFLLNTYFGRKAQPRYSLLAFDAMGLDPTTATGETMLLMRAVMAQGETSQTSERTQKVMAHLKALGVTLGGLPYGKEYSNQIDEHGRRVVVEVPEQVAAIKRISNLYGLGATVDSISNTLQKEGYPTKSGKPWNRTQVRAILVREGLLTIKPHDRSGAIRDSDAVLKRIAELRAQNLSFKDIGRQLTRERILPPVGSHWYSQTVKEVWEAVSTYDPDKASEIARGLRRANYSLRKIGEELALRGLTPAGGGTWHAAQVRLLLLTER